MSGIVSSGVQNNTKLVKILFCNICNSLFNIFKQVGLGFNLSFFESPILKNFFKIEIRLKFAIFILKKNMFFSREGGFLC